MKSFSWTPLRIYSGCCSCHTTLSSGYCARYYSDREGKHTSAKALSVSQSAQQERGADCSQQADEWAERTGSYSWGGIPVLLSLGLEGTLQRHDFRSDLVQPLWPHISCWIKFIFSVLVSCYVNLLLNVSLTSASTALPHTPFARVPICEGGLWLSSTWYRRTGGRTEWGAGCPRSCTLQCPIIMGVHFMTALLKARFPLILLSISVSVQISFKP